MKHLILSALLILAAYNFGREQGETSIKHAVYTCITDIEDISYDLENVIELVEYCQN